MLRMRAGRALLAGVVFTCLLSTAGGEGRGGLHWKAPKSRHESAISLQESSEDDMYVKRRKTAQKMNTAVAREGARVKDAKRKRNTGSGTRVAGLPDATLMEDGSVVSMVQSRKDDGVFYSDEAVREAVEDRPDVFQHPPIEDSEELALWLSIAEAQAKIERRQRELDRRIWVASKQGDSAAAVAAFGLGGCANATDPNGSPSVILACGGGQVSPQDACAWICPAKMWMHLAMSILLHEYIGGARERHRAWERARCGAWCYG